MNEEKVTQKTKEIFNNFVKLKKKAKINSNNLYVYLHATNRENRNKSNLNKFDSDEIMSKKELDKKNHLKGRTHSKNTPDKEEEKIESGRKKNIHQSFYDKYKMFKNQNKNKYTKTPKNQSSKKCPSINKNDIKQRYCSNNNKNSQKCHSVDKEKSLFNIK